MTKENVKHLGTLMRALEPSHVAGILDIELECSQCPFGGKERTCPYLNEISTAKDEALYSNSCYSVLKDFIETGRLVDRRTEEVAYAARE